MNATKIQKTEEQRQTIQTALDAERSAIARNKAGQFATPFLLAREVMRAALAYRPAKEESIRFLEPAVGSGAFYSALMAELDGVALEHAVGVELDPRFARVSQSLWGEHGLTVCESDFTQLVAPSDGAKQANLIVANPPYVRHHHLSASQKAMLQARVRSIVGRTPSGLAGLYIYFMLLAHEWMSEGAIAAWLVPSEWADVNYGDMLRSYLTTQVTLLRVHQFAAEELQFDDALVTSSVVFFRKEKPRENTVCTFSTGPLNSSSDVHVSLDTLRRETKWGRLFGGQSASTQSRLGGVPLSSLFDVKRGIATGANQFFIKPVSEFRRLGIAEKFLRPILPSAKQLKSDVIERRDDGYPKIEEPLALLDCRLAEAELHKHYPEVFSYLQSESAIEVKSRYLTSRRSPWYLQETRPLAPILATYMARGRSGANPFRFFENNSDAIAPNVYLMLVPKPELARMLAKQPSATRVIAEFLRGIQTADLIGQGRVYGGGLHKLEPKELAALDVRELAQSLEISTPNRNSTTVPLFAEALLHG